MKNIQQIISAKFNFVVHELLAFASTPSFASADTEEHRPANYRVDWKKMHLDQLKSILLEIAEGVWRNELLFAWDW